MKHRISIFVDRFPKDELDPHDPIQYKNWELLEYLKDPDFDELDTAKWSRYKFCLVHRYGLFYERPKSIVEICRLLFSEVNEHTRTRIRTILKTGIGRFRRKLKDGKHPFDKTFPSRLRNMGMLRDIHIDLYESYYKKVHTTKEW